MTDLTTITTPFGLLDTETREALRAHGGPYEFVDISGSWDEIDAPAWQKNSTYRVKPAPPKPREWWITAGIASGIHWTRQWRQGAEFLCWSARFCHEQPRRAS